VGLEIESDQFNPVMTVNHTHEGSIGNLCNDRITEHLESIACQFHFEKAEQAEKQLLGLV